MKHLLILAALVAGPAIAQTPAAAPTAKTMSSMKPMPKMATMPRVKAARAPVVRTQKSLDCSKQADAQNVHGKPRKAFMAKCKKA